MGISQGAAKREQRGQSPQMREVRAQTELHVVPKGQDMGHKWEMRWERQTADQELLRDHGREPEGFGERPWNFKQGTVIRYMFQTKLFGDTVENGVKWGRG